MYRPVYEIESDAGLLWRRIVAVILVRREAHLSLGWSGKLAQLVSKRRLQPGRDCQTLVLTKGSSDDLQANRQAQGVCAAPYHDSRPTRQVVCQGITVGQHIFEFIVAYGGASIDGADKDIEVRKVTQHGAAIVIPQVDCMIEL